MSDAKNFQCELFSDFPYQWKRLGSGCFGAAYAHPNGEWVWKIGSNDGTRSYLEWCLHRERMGERMPGMPEIDFLMDYGNYQYLCAMKRYQSIEDRTGEYGWKMEKRNNCWNGEIQEVHPVYDLPKVEGCPQYLKALLMMWEHETGEKYNDLHHGNIMWDKERKELIITDPSSSGYRKLGTKQSFNWPSEFQLKP